MIERPFYLDRLRRLRGPGMAKVLTGMRRSGKSGILRLLEHQLLEEGVGAERIVFLDLELMRNASLRDATELLRYVRSRLTPHQTSYVMIDEAQGTTGIGHVAYELLETQDCDLYLTGSHAHLVEHELADVMTGRYVEIPVFPLSFAEYLAAHTPQDGGPSQIGPASARDQSQDGQFFTQTSMPAHASPHIMELFGRYLQNGGLPQTLLFENDSYALNEYLDGVYHTVIRRDVASGIGREDPALLDAIVRHLMAHVGEPTSSNGIARSLTSAGRSCSDDTVSLYLTALFDAHAFHRVPRLDLKTGMLLKTQERLYADDLGLRSLLLGGSGPSLQGTLENVVYLELRRRFSQVYVGRHYTRHISFVTRSAQGRAYYMVAPSVLDPQVLQSNLATLQAERDNYPKTLLTLDSVGEGSHEGILQRNAVSWLLDTSG